MPIPEEKIRAYLLPRALEEERARLRNIRWARWLILGGLAYFPMLFVSIALVSLYVSEEMARHILEFKIVGVVGTIPIGLGLVGLMLYSKNSTMTLTEKERDLL